MPANGTVSSAPVPVTVVAGFLGAGKTTLLNHILTAEHDRRIGVLVNDFGSINIDAELISEVEDGVVTLANGCICCTIRMDLIGAVLELAGHAQRPDHIVIESSGVADPAEVAQTFLGAGIWDKVLLDGVITVVDAEQALGLPEEEAQLARAQVAGGDVIVLNKIDLADAATLARVREWIRDIAPGVQVFEANQCRLPMEILLGSGGADTQRKAAGAELGVHVHEVSTGGGTVGAHPEHDHGLLFDTWTFASPRPMRMERLQQLLGHLPSTLFRVKGFVHSVEEAKKRTVLQLVGRRATVTATRPWGTDPPQTRLVFISRHGAVDFSVLEEALERCQERAQTR